jgi:hypothetical protein
MLRVDPRMRSCPLERHFRPGSRKGAPVPELEAELAGRKRSEYWTAGAIEGLIACSACLTVWRGRASAGYLRANEIPM